MRVSNSDVSCSDSYFFGRDIYRMDTSVPIGLVGNYTLRFAASGSDTVSASLQIVVRGFHWRLLDRFR